MPARGLPLCWHPFFGGGGGGHTQHGMGQPFPPRAPSSTPQPNPPFQPLPTLSFSFWALCLGVLLSQAMLGSSSLPSSSFPVARASTRAPATESQQRKNKEGPSGAIRMLRCNLHQNSSLDSKNSYCLTFPLESQGEKETSATSRPAHHQQPYTQGMGKCASGGGWDNIHTHTRTYIYIYIYI